MLDSQIGALMLVQATITDPERFVEYAKRTPELITRFGGRYIAMRTETELLEGQQDERKIVVSAWPSMRAAREFWNSEEYARVKEFRKDAADVQVTLIACNAQA